MRLRRGNHCPMTQTRQSGITSERSLCFTSFTLCCTKSGTEELPLVSSQHGYTNSSSTLTSSSSGGIYTKLVTRCFLCVLHAFTFFRAAVERNILGLRDIVPLTPYEMGKSLGPGYKAGVTKSSQSNVELC